MAETYRIYLDETGNFEQFSALSDSADIQKPIRAVGGIVVPPSLQKKEADIRAGMTRIRDKYFPGRKSLTDIHLSDQEKDFSQKQEIKKEMLDFFRKEMKGAGIAFIYDTSELKVNHQPPGAQLYRNMLVTLLRALICLHPDFDEEACFDARLAHRRVPYPLGFDRNLAGQGYLKLKEETGSGKTWYTAITEADIITIMDQNASQLRFVSKRTASYKMKPFALWDDPFMAMADCICYTTRGILLRTQEPRDIHASLQQQFGRESLLFYCTADYEVPENLLTCFHDNRTAEFITGYLERDTVNPFSDNYLLIPAVRKTLKALVGTTNPEQCDTLLSLAERFLEDRLFHRLDEVGVLCKLVKDRMEQVSTGNADQLWDLLAFRYHDAALRLANHTGNVIAGCTHRDSGEKLFSRNSGKTIEQQRSHHEFVNRASVTDDNEFAFERSIARLEPVRQKEAQITELLGGGRNEIFGKICGSLGQNYAFLKRSADAAKCFELARNHLRQNDPMQASFRAHLALDNNDLSTYEKDLSLLMGKSSFPGWEECVRLCFENIRANSFTFHLVLKGMLVFSADKNEEERIVNRFGVDPQNPPSRYHPWELIFILLGRICENIRKPVLARQYWRGAAGFPKEPDQLTMIMLGHSARAWEALSLLENGKTREAGDAMSPLGETFRILAKGNQAPGILNPNRVPDALDGKVREGWFDSIGEAILKSSETAGGKVIESLAKRFVERFTFNYW